MCYVRGRRLSNEKPNLRWPRGAVRQRTIATVRGCGVRPRKSQIGDAFLVGAFAAHSHHARGPSGKRAPCAHIRIIALGHDFVVHVPRRRRVPLRLQHADTLGHARARHLDPAADLLVLFPMLLLVSGRAVHLPTALWQPWASRTPPKLRRYICIEEP